VSDRLSSRYRRSPRAIRSPVATVLSALAVALLGPLTGGCESDGTRPEAWTDVSLDDQPNLFERRRGHPALTDLRDLYLGQSRDSALETIRRYCGDDVIERGEGMFGGEATFLGCRVERDGPVQFVRVGFWPRLDERVATLEVKRTSVPPAAVYDSFRRLIDEEPDNRVLRPQIVQLEYPEYRLFADWDQGLDGPTHLTVGFDPKIAPDRARPSQ